MLKLLLLLRKHSAFHASYSWFTTFPRIPCRSTCSTVGSLLDSIYEVAGSLNGCVVPASVSALPWLRRVFRLLSWAVCSYRLWFWPEQLLSVGTQCSWRADTLMYREQTDLHLLVSPSSSSCRVVPSAAYIRDARPREASKSYMTRVLNNQDNLLRLVRANGRAGSQWVW